MPDPSKRLERLRDQMQDVWERFETAADNGETILAASLDAKFRNLEEFERQLRDEIKQNSRLVARA